MEEILITRLRSVITIINNHTVNALKLINQDLVSCAPSIRNEAELTRKNLETAINRFSNELHIYFQTSTEPSPDDISHFSEIQLKGEETLNELTLKLQPVKENLNYNENTLSAKLPRFDLPQFSGNPLEWPGFWDTFVSNIDSKRLADVDKLMYLKSTLKGEARDAIDGMEMRNLNYNIAVKHLKERFGNETLIIDAHYSSLYKIKTADSTPQDCRKVLNEIEKHLRVLDSLNENVNHNNLRFIIMEKFPEDVIYEIRSKSTSYTISEMRDQLEKIISAREDANRIKERREKETSERKNYSTEALHVREAKHDQFKKIKYNNSLGKFNSCNSQERNRSYAHSSKNSYNPQHLRHNNQRSFTNRQLFNKEIENARKRCRETNDVNKFDSTAPTTKKRKLNCIFCKGAHYNDQCKRVHNLKDRKEILRDRCFNCLRVGHSILNCKINNTCYHCKEKGKHNRALCPNRKDAQPETSPFKRKGEVQSTNIMHLNNQGHNTVLQTAVTKVAAEASGTKTIRCRILMDSGSQRSYITQNLMKALNLSIEEETQLSVFTFGTVKPQEYNSPLVKLHIWTQDNITKVIFANVVPVIAHGIPCPEWDRLNNRKLADDGSLGEKIDILIGNDYYFTFMSTEKLEIQDNLFLVKSEFGWMLTGKLEATPMNKLSVITYVQSRAEDKYFQLDLPLVNVNFKTLFDLETIGITDSPKITKDEEAIINFNETTKIVDNRYTVCWPWIEYPPELPTNLGMAYGRLINLLKRLDKKTLNLYNQTLKEQLDKGIIEIVPHPHNIEKHPIHYLPHHCVHQPGKSLRIVYDASAKTKNSKSLNECLHSGPMLLEDLTSLILRFRKHRIGITSDVEKAFLQIALQEKDKDVTRFLWLRDFEKGATKENIIYYRFCRVPFGIISSPFLLNATIKHHLMQSEIKVLKGIANDIYVDNMVTGTETLAQAFTLYEETKRSFQTIRMNLREWSSNNKEFMNTVSDRRDDRLIKILGLEWDTELDTIQIRLKPISHETTKRGVLAIVASIFDPCGLVAPMILPAKLLLQQLWKQKKQWDETLPEETQNKWNNIVLEFQNIRNLNIPRPYQGINEIDNRKYELHCFSDASLQAYAAVIYLRTYQELSSESYVSFVIGKSRVTPIKNQVHLQIPRLELLGALIGTRLLRYTEESLKLSIKKKYLWVDSEIVLNWLNTTKLLDPFVARRIREIKENKDLNMRYIPSYLNPADNCTRTTNVTKNTIGWLLGPQFLKMSPENWPKTKTNIPTNIHTLTECTVAGEDLPKNNRIQEIPSLNLPKNDKVTEIKQLQEDYFPIECNGKETNLSRNLKLFKDVNGILRCRGRMQNADWPFDKKYPILIPKDSEFTNLLIKRMHEDNKHVGVNHTLSAIRQLYWIPQGKVQVQKVLRKCASCVKHGGGPFALPPTPALPTERVNYSSPFTFTGMDYLGPILVNTENGLQKRWISLYTCLAVRAIHLEIVQDLSAEEGLLALRRMMATRGVPALVTSDNASQFKLMSEILTKPYCIEKGIKWKFIPQLAPWFGGFYERLIALVKHCMKRTLHKHLLKDNQLLTIVKEIEAVLNTRPLTVVDSEVGHILKPSDFLTMGRNLLLKGSKEDLNVEGTITKTDLIKSWKRALIILEEFKTMFTNQYLHSLREKYWHSPKEPRVKSNKTPQIGQIVQIKDDKRNREEWKVGKIVTLLEGKDGYFRVAKVKVGDIEYTRSISQLYPLEIEEEETVIPTKDSYSSYSEVDTLQIPETEMDETGNNIEITDEINEITIKESTQAPLEDNFNENITVPDEAMLSSNVEENLSRNEVHNTPEPRPRREAATRALEKIREWTRNLTILL